MKLQVFVVLLVVGLMNHASAKGKISCRSCISSDYSSLSSSCYDNPNNATSYVCPHHSFYCRTQIQIKDGFPTMIQRGCVNPENDHDKTTRHTPRYSHCITDVDQTTHEENTICYYPCHTNNCNNITTKVLRPCKGDCRVELENGHCNYITGRCVCAKGWAGSNCEQPLRVPSQTHYRKCVQCNDEIDRECSTKTLATPCMLDSTKHQRCSTIRTSIFDSKKNIVRSYMSKGCIEINSSENQCFFSTSTDPSYTGHTQYKCVSSCETDGCNAGTPSEMPIFPAGQDLHCLVCESTDEDSACARGETTRQLCPFHNNYCKSTATYFISEKRNLRYKVDPEYKFDRIIRECASHVVTRKCATKKIETLNAKFVTCRETCQGDGCNTGWPARPKCAQCESTYSSEGYDRCLEAPNWPTQCSKPYQGYCVAEDYRKKAGEGSTESSSKGFRRMVRRGCTYHNFGTYCEEVVFRGINVTNCNKTCTDTGCNLGLLNTSAKLKSGKTSWFTSLAILLSAFYFRP